MCLIPKTIQSLYLLLKEKWQIFGSQGKGTLASKDFHEKHTVFFLHYWSPCLSGIYPYIFPKNIGSKGLSISGKHRLHCRLWKVLLYFSLLKTSDVQKVKDNKLEFQTFSAPAASGLSPRITTEIIPDSTSLTAMGTSPTCHLHNISLRN